MARTNALARLSDLATNDALPFASRALHRLRAAVDDRVTAMIGKDVGDKLAQATDHVTHGGIDPFGFDPAWAKYAVGFAGFLHRSYFRTDVHGIANVPSGRVLLISNHSGQIPIDGAVIGAAMLLDADPPRLVRSMVEKWSQTLPFVSTLFTRCGQVVGVPENAKRLLAREEALLVFPEGSRGISKPFSQRYQLTEFGLGFMRLALETNTPIVPIAVVGAEEQYVSLANLEALGKVMGAPSFPVIPQLLVPGGQLPLPTKYRIYFGEPLRFAGDPDDDDAVIEEKVWVVKATIQSMVNRGLKDRKSLFW